MALSESALAWCLGRPPEQHLLLTAEPLQNISNWQEEGSPVLSITFFVSISVTLLVTLTNTSPHLNTHTHTSTQHLNKHSYLWAMLQVSQGEWNSLWVTGRGSWCSLPAQSWTETCTPRQVPPCCLWTGSSLDTKWFHVTECVRITVPIVLSATLLRLWV